MDEIIFFCIPMKIPRLYTIDELLKMNKENHYIKGGKRNAYISFYKEVNGMYYSVIPIRKVDTRICLGNDFDNAMINLKKLLETFKESNAKGGMIYDYINILYPKERSDINGCK